MRRWLDVSIMIDIKEIPKNITVVKQNVLSVKNIPNPVSYLQPGEKGEEVSRSTGDLSEQTICVDDVMEAGYNQLLFFDFECR